MTGPPQVQGYVAMETFGLLMEGGFRTFLELPNGIPMPTLFA